MTDITRRTLFSALLVPFIPRALDALCRRKSIQIVIRPLNLDDPRIVASIMAAIREAAAEPHDIIIIDGKRPTQ
jgi:hypothetical protein